MAAYGPLRYAQAASDLGVGVPGGDQVQQLPCRGVSRGTGGGAARRPGRPGAGAGAAVPAAPGHARRSPARAHGRTTAARSARARRPALARGRHSWSSCSIPNGRSNRGTCRWNAIAGPSRSPRSSRRCAGRRSVGVAAGLAVPVVLPVRPIQILSAHRPLWPACPARTRLVLPAVKALERHSVAADLAHQLGQQGQRQPVPSGRSGRSSLTMAARVRRSRSLAVTGVLTWPPFPRLLISRYARQHRSGIRRTSDTRHLAGRPHWPLTRTSLSRKGADMRNTLAVAGLAWPHSSA